MTVDPANLSAASIVERAKNILIQPRSEWDRIATEKADIGKIYVGYVLPLAVIAAVAGLIGMSVFGVSAFGVSYRVPIVAGAISAVIQVAGYVIGVYVIAVIANALAPSFGSTQDQGQAHKLMAYSFTAALLSGVFAILPALSVLGLLGLYSFVLLFIGLPRLMKTPPDKRVGYLVTLIVVGLIVFIVIGVVLGAVRGAVGGFGAQGGFTFGQSTPPRSASRGEITLPGGGSVDVGAMERAAEGYAQGGGGSVDPAQLASHLPQSLPGGFTLTSQSSGGAMGAASAEGVYENGNARLTLSVVHMGAMSGLAAIAGAANVQQNRQDANGYARTRTVEGRVITEEASNSAGTASYSVVGRGVAITAEGSGGVSIDQARAAVEAIGIERMEREFGP
ncbi:MAG: Yip1 family protein [Hyphomonadaceae bacterium]